MCQEVALADPVLQYYVCAQQRVQEELRGWRDLVIGVEGWESGLLGSVPSFGRGVGSNGWSWWESEPVLPQLC